MLPNLGGLLWNPFTNLWLSCIRSLAEEKDGNVVEHPGLVEVGVEHHLVGGGHCFIWIC